jgi:ribosomal protein L7/L12
MVSDQDFQQLRSRMLELEDQVAFLYKHFGVVFVPEAGVGDDPRIVDLLRQGKMIDAIKIYRELTRCGLAEAKRGVEDIQRRLGLPLS